jgi:vacuolar protein-sorting-associated protein 4
MSELSKQRLRTKVTEYKARMEQIQGFLSKVARQQSRSSGDGTEGAASPEVGPMQRALDTSVLRERVNVRWQDLAGLGHAQTALREAFVLPIKFPQLFSGARRPRKSVLLYGVCVPARPRSSEPLQLPGTGKASLAMGLANDAKTPIHALGVSELLSRTSEESERSHQLISRCLCFSRANLIPRLYEAHMLS